MYSVSDAYLEAISQFVRTFKIKAQFSYQNVAQAVFDDSTIIGEAKIESQAVSGSTSCGIIDIGAVPTAIATLTVIDSDANLKKYSGASFTMCVSLLLENGEYEDVPMGKYFCDTSKMSRIGNRISIFGYDAMKTFDYTLTDTQREALTNKTAPQAVLLLVESAKCEFNQNLSDFPNSDLPLDFSNTQVVTGWDGIMWIAQLMGCFARINRQNHLEFVPIKSKQQVRTITESERYNTTFSDDRIHIAGISMPDENNNLITRGGGGSENNSNVMIALERNPLIKSDYSLENVLDNILTQLSTVYFYKFHAEIINDPALDAGDTVRLTGGLINGTNQNNDIVGFITHNVWRYRGQHEIINTGQTPNTDSDDIVRAAPQSQSEKLLNSISGKTNEMVRSVGDIINIIHNDLGHAASNEIVSSTGETFGFTTGPNLYYAYEENGYKKPGFAVCGRSTTDIAEVTTPQILATGAASATVTRNIYGPLFVLAGILEVWVIIESISSGVMRVKLEMYPVGNPGDKFIDNTYTTEAWDNLFGKDSVINYD